MKRFSMGMRPIWLSLFLILMWLATACTTPDAAGVAAPLDDPNAVSLTVYRDPT